MCRKPIHLLLVSVLALSTVAQAADIVWVSDNKGYNAANTEPPVEPNVAADHGWVDLLRAQGHNVIYKNEFEYVDGTQYWRTLDPNKIAELEAADLIVISRNADSGSYSTVADNEPNQWNAVTTPILSMNFHMARSNKWGWINGTSNKEAKAATVNVIDANHPIFAGVAIDPNGQVAMLSDQWNVDWILNVMDAGNGQLLATRATDGVLSIATWEAGQKFFEAGAAVAGGPRMLFIGGTGSKNTNPNYSPDGAYNLTAEGEKMFLNAVQFMLLKGKKIVWAAMNWDADNNGVNDSQEWVDKLVAAGYSVDFRPGYWDALTDEKAVELNAADLVIISGTVQSGTYASNAAEVALWNSVAVPMMNCSPYVIRSNRWKWSSNGDGSLPNNNGDQGAPLLQAIAVDHPIFNGIALDPNNQVQIVDPNLGSGNASFLNTADVGNGTLIGKTVGNEWFWIAEWATGVEFYDGAGYTATNRRMFFSIGAHEGGGQPARGYNFTDEGWKLFLNAVVYMMTPPVDPLAQGLVAYYAMEGDTNDASDNGLHGVVESVGGGVAPTFVDGPAGYGTAMDFLPSATGTVGSVVNCGADPLFDFMDAVTVGAWVNMRSIPDEWRAIVAKGDNAWRISNVGLTRKFHFGFCGYASRATPHGIDGTIEVAFSEWHHVCGTYDITDGARLYVDGVLDVALVDTAGINVNTNDVWIGGNNGDTGWKPYRLFDGTIDEVRIYDRALSADEIALLVQ
ncbi:MAG: LamG domain-containing protein [Phycisphaerae bacterium]|nr:LamG domain-containing protein [Phycisphaerae bacterium]